MNIGEKIISYRKKMNYSQEKLAEMLGVTRQTLSNWEDNITVPDLKQAKKLADIFHIAVDELTNSEKLLISLVKKQMTLTKVIIFTIYFIILGCLITFSIYELLKKDFTYPTDASFVCVVDDKEYPVYVTDNENDVYKIVIGDEEYLGGNSISELMETLNVVKKMLINNGGKCYH